jgi:Fe2+ or Zn2+ uptake regulation protein
MQRGPDRFDKTLARHEHLICTECGALSDAYLGDLQEFLSAKTEVTILDYDINMRYICQQCRQKKEEVK